MDYVRTEPLRWRDFQFKEISYAEENKFGVDGLAKKKYIQSCFELLLKIDHGDKRDLLGANDFQKLAKNWAVKNASDG